MFPIPDPLLAVLTELPEIHKCPKCNGSIADWVVTSKFECPDCKRKLASNKKVATKQSAIFAIVLYLVLLALIYMFSFSENVKLILYIAARYFHYLHTISALGYCLNYKY